MRDFIEAIGSDHEIHLAYMTSGEHVEDSKQAAIYASTTQLKLNALTVRTGISSIRDLAHLVRLVQRFKIERVITHMVHVSPLLRSLRAVTGVPFAIYFKWVLSTPNAGVKVIWGNAGVDRAVAVSAFVRDFWARNGISTASFAVVPEGIEVSDYRPRQRSVRPTIGFAGRIVPEKGLMDLLDAMPLILSRHPGTILRIAGAFRTDKTGDSYRAQVEARIAMLGIGDKVVFDGFVTPLESWLADHHLIVVPSTCDDAQPIVMMQAMATATPVVATRVGGIPEVLNGPFEHLLVPPGDSVALGTRIASQLSSEDGGTKIGIALRYRCMERYSRQAHIDSLTRALGLQDEPIADVACRGQE